MPRPFVLGALRLLLLLGPGLCAALRVGVLDRYFPFAYYTEAGRITGFDVELAREACTLAGQQCEIVPIAAVADRIPTLQNGTVDVLAAALVVTPERQQQVQFVHPFYYCSGTALRALEQDVASLAGGWESIRGKPVCTVTGHYLNDYIAATYGPQLMFADTEEQCVDSLVAGRCIAAYTDSASLVFRYIAETRFNASVQFVESAEPLDVQPYGLAVRQNDTELAVRLSGALAQGLMSAGNASRIYSLQEKFILAAGGQPAACLPVVTSTLTDMGLSQ